MTERGPGRISRQIASYRQMAYLTVRKVQGISLTIVRKATKLSDQIRQVIIASGISRYRICKTVGLSEATMSRFMSGRGGLSMEMLDKIGAYLNLEVVTRGRKGEKGTESKP